MASFVVSFTCFLKNEQMCLSSFELELLFDIADNFGSHIYEEYKDTVISLIRENIERAFEKPSTPMSGVESGRMSPSEQIFHESAGWRNLETAVKCIQSMIDGCGDNFWPYIDQDLLDLIFTTLKHENRFVR